MLNYRRNRGFVFNSFVITPREIVASITIIAVLFLFGCLISSKITQHHLDRVEIYNKSLKIDNTELFKYGMKTNVGNSFVYGELEAVDKVSNYEINGEYMYLKQVTEEYTRHTRIVSNGKTSYTQVYYTWDEKDEQEQMCKQLSFCNVIFPSSKIIIPDSHYISTVYVSKTVRHAYYGTGVRFKGTLFTSLKDNTIRDKSPFYANQTIDNTVESLSHNYGIVGFWIIWIILIIAAVLAFYYFDNRWLE